MNSATAGGVLGGSVTTHVTHSGKDKGDGACEFIRAGSVTYTLRIEVTTMAHVPSDFKSWLAQCGRNSTPVRGIGNEAIACDLTKDSQVSAQILSRVRERAFLVRVTANKSSAPLVPLREQAHSAADQVSGNLF
ncbi:MAG: hypothetical protein M3Y24_13750 [Acidobacteriota bacterium]|nr:hypothetical protein [Acidobacteriota bacterium]